jgi:aconitate hydratase
MSHNLFSTFQSFSAGAGRKGRLYSLPALEKAGVGPVSKLPVSIRLVLESVLRNCDGRKITEEHVRQLANWKPNSRRTDEIPFVVARIVLQDFTGVPLLADLAAMRGVAKKMGKNPKLIEPLVPVDLVVDHSVQIDHYGTKNALDLNMKLEFQRNRERYQFLKWGMQAFDTFKVVPPGIGIVHQVNLEYLARGVHEKDGVYYPDTLVGTDSHTTMINGIGVVGWGVGGIEAEAGMLGQPVYFLTPDVVGVHLKGKLRWGVTATDLVLTLTEMLRKQKVVGKFVEFFGEGTAGLPVPARVRRHHGILPDGRQDRRVPAQHRSHRPRDRGLRGVLPRAGHVRHAEAGRDRLQPDAGTRPVGSGAFARRSETPAGPHRDRRHQGEVHRAFLEAGFGKRL